MKKTDDPPADEFQIRCPRLGDLISFSYCLRENNGLPCTKTLDCWHQYFDVESFLKERLTDDEWKKVFVAPAKPKIISLVEMIEQVKASLKKDQ